MNYIEKMIIFSWIASELHNTNRQKNSNKILIIGGYGSEKSALLNLIN